MIAANAALANSYDYSHVVLRVLMTVSAFCTSFDLISRVHSQQQPVAKEVA
jgi:NO-binding membrane sensor protein with MHYT domain